MTTSSPTTAFGEQGRGRPPVRPFGRAGTAVGVAVVVAVVAATLALVAWGRATASTRPDLFGGSLVLDDERPLTVVNLATGEVTVQLAGVSDQVGASSYGQVQAVAAAGGTWLVDRATGTFNLLAEDNYVVDPTGGGVGLGPLPGATAAAGYASGADAYIVRQAPASTVSLVEPATVEEAARTAGGGATSSVTPRGFASLAGEVVLRPGAATVAGSSLWTLVTTPRGCTVVQLTPTARGRGLAVRARAATASCATATLASAGGVVGLLTPGRVQTWAGGLHRSVAVAATGRLSAAVPASDTGAGAGVGVATPAGPAGGAAEVWWMARTPAGWEAVGAGADGTTSGPTLLRGIPVTADPAPPEYADGHLFTMDQAVAGQPELWVADPLVGAVGTVAGVPTYPARSSAEQASFTGAEVVGSGPRVVYNNPASLLAVVVFTDGSHPAVVIDKSSAVVVAATGAATVATGPPPTPKKGRHGSAVTTPTTTPGPAPAAPTVDQQVSCATTTEKPYAPQISGIVPASETAQVSWTYQTLAVQDCEPDSWSVTLTALSGPQPAQPVQTVNGQQQLDVGGLRPATPYRAVVTAYINAQSTASQPVTFTTTAQGPDAPTSVRTDVDANGDWVVSWTPCRAATCYVPADQWTVTGSACGAGYVGQPPTTVVSGSVDQASFDAASLGLLGQSVSFRVQGSLADGLQGNPRSDGTCTQSWRPPQASAISLHAAGTVTGQSVTATLQVSPAPSDTSVYGSLGTDFTYHVGPVTVGPTTATTVTVPGLTPDSSYTPSVTVTPIGHPAAAVTVQGAAFSDNLAWSPGLAVTATPHVDADPDTGTVDATFADLAPGPYTAAGTITCGSVATQVGATVSGSSVAFPDFDVVDNGGDCTLAVTLHDTASPDPYGVDSPILSAPVDWGPAPQYGFAATYTQACDPLLLCSTTVQVTTTSPGPLGGAGWNLTAAQQAGTPQSSCSVQQSSQQAPTSATLTIRGGCPPADVDPVTVTVGWRYFGQQQSVQATVSGQSGTVPTTTTTTTTTTTAPAPTTTVPAPTSTLPATTLPASTTTAAAGARAATSTGPTDLASMRAGVPDPSAPAGGSSAPVTVLAGLALAALVSTPLRRRRRRAGGGKERP